MKVFRYICIVAGFIAGAVFCHRVIMPTVGFRHGYPMHIVFGVFAAYAVAFATGIIELVYDAVYWVCAIILAWRDRRPPRQ